MRMRCGRQRYDAILFFFFARYEERAIPPAPCLYLNVCAFLVFVSVVCFPPLHLHMKRDLSAAGSLMGQPTTAGERAWALWLVGLPGFLLFLTGSLFFCLCVFFLSFFFSLLFPCLFSLLPFSPYSQPALPFSARRRCRHVRHVPKNRNAAEAYVRRPSPSTFFASSTRWRRTPWLGREGGRDEAGKHRCGFRPAQREMWTAGAGV